MQWIVGGLVVVLTALNAPSTAQAANRCVSLGWWPGGAHGLLVVRPGQRFSVRQPNCLVDQVVIVPVKSPIAVTVSGPGWHGTLHSTESHVDGVVSAHALFGGTLESGGHANLEQLRKRLETTRTNGVRLRWLLAVPIALIAGALAWVAIRRHCSPISTRS